MMRWNDKKLLRKLQISVLALVFLACNPDSLVVDCAVSDFAVKVTKVRIADCGLQNGEVTLTATGGTPPYEFQLEGENPQEANVFDNLVSQIDPYNFVVTDRNGCEQSVSTLVGQKGPFTANATISTSGCGTSNAKIIAEPFNGVAPYKYQLGENGQYQDENYWENLPAGIFSVWIADANNCYMGIRDIHITSGVSYSESIGTIFSTSCSTTDCHGGAQSPDLSEFSGISANGENIKTKMNSTPTHGSITAEESRLLTCWIDDGLPNN